MNPPPDPPHFVGFPQQTPPHQLRPMIPQLPNQSGLGLKPVVPTPVPALGQFPMMQMQPPFPFMNQQGMRPPPIPAPAKVPRNSKGNVYPPYIAGQMPRLPKRRPKPPGGKMPSIPTIPPPPPPLPIPVSPSACAPPHFLPESHNFIQLLNALPDDRSSLFFSLFESQPGKRKDEKLEQFLSTVLPRLAKSNPNALTFLTCLLEQLRTSTEVCSGLRDVPMPIFFSKCKGHRPIYKFLPLNSQGFELLPSPKEKRLEAALLMGMFVSLAEPVPSCAIRVDKTDVPPLPFGGAYSFYVLCEEGHIPPRLQISFPVCPQSFLTWFVVEFVERRPIGDVFRELTAVVPNAAEGTLFARTANCQNCAFQFSRIVSELSLNGLARCPECGAPVALGELAFEVREEGKGEQLGPVVHEARLALADCLGGLAKWPRDDGAWARELFAEAGEWPDEGCPLSFAGTEAFIGMIEHMG
jgi:predicted Zn-ribbon and HTH transcriptional regulator